jgi:hypothetical protein
VPPASSDGVAPVDATEPLVPIAAPSVGPEPAAEPAPAPAPAPSVPATAASATPAAQLLATAGPKPTTRFASTARALDRPGIRTAASVTDDEQWRGALRLLGAAGRTGAPPILILLVAFAFLAAQDRIDRNDPKLALAPVHGHQELTFKAIDRGTP